MPIMKSVNQSIHFRPLDYEKQTMSVHTHAETYKVIHATVKDVNIMRLSDCLIPR